MRKSAFFPGWPQNYVPIRDNHQSAVRHRCRVLAPPSRETPVAPQRTDGRKPVQRSASPSVKQGRPVAATGGRARSGTPAVGIPQAQAGESESRFHAIQARRPGFRSCFRLIIRLGLRPPGPGQPFLWGFGSPSSGRGRLCGSMRGFSRYSLFLANARPAAEFR